MSQIDRNQSFFWAVAIALDNETRPSAGRSGWDDEHAPSRRLDCGEVMEQFSLSNATRRVFGVM